MTNMINISVQLEDGTITIFKMNHQLSADEPFQPYYAIPRFLNVELLEEAKNRDTFKITVLSRAITDIPRRHPNCPHAKEFVQMYLKMAQSLGLDDWATNDDHNRQIILLTHCHSYTIRDMLKHTPQKIIQCFDIDDTGCHTIVPDTTNYIATWEYVYRRAIPVPPPTPEFPKNSYWDKRSKIETNQTTDGPDEVFSDILKGLHCDPWGITHSPTRQKIFESIIDGLFGTTSKRGMIFDRTKNE